jgi:hypothetical protein
MTARLAARIEVSAVIRRIEGLGGTGMVLARGDGEAGAILLILTDRGAFVMALERSLDADGCYRWRRTGPQATENQDILKDFCDRRRRSDPDLWIVELDIAGAERFGAEMIAMG